MTGWSWWKAALWAIPGLQRDWRVSLHLTELGKLTSPGRYLNKREVQPSSPCYRLPDNVVNTGLNWESGQWPAWFSSAIYWCTKLHDVGAMEPAGRPDGGLTNTWSPDCSPPQRRTMWGKSWNSDGFCLFDYLKSRLQITESCVSVYFVTWWMNAWVETQSLNTNTENHSDLDFFLLKSISSDLIHPHPWCIWFKASSGIKWSLNVV